MRLLLPSSALLGTFFAIASCGESGSASSSSTTSNPTANGDDSGQPEEAREPDPAAAAAAVREGQAALGRSELDAAIAAWKRAHEFDPTDATIGRRLVELLLGNHAQADPALALEVLDRTFGDDLEDRALELLRARGAYRSHRYDLCRSQIAAWNLETKQVPTAIATEAYFLLGSMAEREGDYDEAGAAYRTGLEANSQSALLRCRLGVVSDELGDPDAALREIDRAIAIDPGFVEAHFHRADLLRRAGQDDEAAHAQEVYRELLRYSELRAETEAAYLVRYEALSRLATIFPEYTDGRLKLAEYQLIRELDEEAVQTARALISDKPDLVGAYRFYIEALRRTVGDEQARSALETLLAEEPNIPMEQQRPILKIILDGFAQ